MDEEFGKLLTCASVALVLAMAGPSLTLDGNLALGLPVGPSAFGVVLGSILPIERGV
ncbi:MAG: hypothetical protein MAG715_00862 [Methanonatronarchaeales archaeon]|nr:hypothetical protein [Methanonatronarchaeales archaeon]